MLCFFGGRFTTGKSIRKRDKSVYKRKEFGHWEVDTVVSGRGKTKACFATIAERKTRYYIAVKMPNRTGQEMAKAIIDELSKLPKGAVKTITCDRSRTAPAVGAHINRQYTPRLT